MAIPRANKIRSGNVEFTSSVDKAQYTLRELSLAASRDTGRMLNYRIRGEAKKLPGMRRSKRVTGAFSYWARPREGDLLIGTKHGTWYGVEQELGSNRQPKRSIIRRTVMRSVDDIRRVQGQYISAIENDNKARGLIGKGKETGGD